MDLRVFQALGATGVAVVAAVTAQNSRRVSVVHPLPARVVRRQLEALWEELEPAALCIGLLGGAAVTREIRSFIGALAHRPPIVIDPVLASSSGHQFVSARERSELWKLFALATVVTPNASEAAVLTRRRVVTADDAAAAALELAQSGSAVLVTGGHLRERDVVDVLASGERVIRYRAARSKRTMRGAGTILAAAIAAWQAWGVGLEQSVERARRFVRLALRRARPTILGAAIAQP
jgi:hydroxymethylpyrimidine kinase/phosphomethylpyrimidine kinase